MLSHRAKRLFYMAAGPIMKVNGDLYRRFRAPSKGEIKVHLGPGQDKYLEGWVNVDANTFTGKCDVWADLRNPLPFRDGSITCFYSHHTIEHLPDLHAHFSDIFRCLKPGGVYRTGGPNGDNAIKKFAEGDKDWFNDFPDNRKSIGGRFENFIFCRREHLTILTKSYLYEILEDIGFTNLKECFPTRESGHNSLFADAMAKEYISNEECPDTLIIEAEKPL